MDHSGSASPQSSSSSEAPTPLPVIKPVIDMSALKRAHSEPVGFSSPASGPDRRSPRSMASPTRASSQSTSSKSSSPKIDQALQDPEPASAKSAKRESPTRKSPQPLVPLLRRTSRARTAPVRKDLYPDSGESHPRKRRHDLNDSGRRLKRAISHESHMPVLTHPWRWAVGFREGDLCWAKLGSRPQEPLWPVQVVRRMIVHAQDPILHAIGNSSVGASHSVKRESSDSIVTTARHLDLLNVVAALTSDPERLKLKEKTESNSSHGDGIPLQRRGSEASINGGRGRGRKGSAEVLRPSAGLFAQCVPFKPLLGGVKQEMSIHYIVRPLPAKLEIPFEVTAQEECFYKTPQDLIPFAMHDPVFTHDQTRNRALIQAIHIASTWGAPDVEEAEAEEKRFGIRADLSRSSKLFYERGGHTRHIKRLRSLVTGFSDERSERSELETLTVYGRRGLDQVRIGCERIVVGDMIRLSSKVSKAFALSTPPLNRRMGMAAAGNGPEYYLEIARLEELEAGMPSRTGRSHHVYATGFLYCRVGSGWAPLKEIQTIDMHRESLGRAHVEYPLAKRKLIADIHAHYNCETPLSQFAHSSSIQA